MQFSENVVTLEEVVRTSQNRPASPPKPQTPIPEPTDEIIEEEITNLDELSISDFSDSASVAMLGNKGNSDQPVSNPQTPPSPVRIVELTVPDAAQKANIKAEIWVTFLVDEQGNVEEASISQVKRYDQSSGEVTTVQTIGYGLTEAALDAALQWKFRPARNNGGAVKAYSRQTFSVGF
jgi:outer membrane biosynthesis protein TonB